MTLELTPSTSSIPSLLQAGVPHVLAAAELGMELQVSSRMSLGAGTSPFAQTFAAMTSQTGKPMRAPLDLDYVPMIVGKTAGKIDLTTLSLTGFSVVGGVGDVNGIYDLTFTSAADHDFTVTIYGRPILYHMTGAFVANTVRDGIIAAIAADLVLSAKITAVANAAKVRITELAGSVNGAASIGGVDANTSSATVTAHTDGDVVAYVLVGRTAGMKR